MADVLSKFYHEKSLRKHIGSKSLNSSQQFLFSSHQFPSSLKWLIVFDYVVLQVSHLRDRDDCIFQLKIEN